MPMTVTYILGVLGAIGATVVAAILLMPQKNVSKMNKFFYELHKIVNFKSLLLEKILKILYVFSTALCILTGFFMLISWETPMWGDPVYYGGYGILVMLVGPIVIRIIYEAMIMFVLLVNNTIEIRKHLTDKSEEAVASKPEVEKAAPEYVFCVHCGARYDKNNENCPNGCAK